MPQSVSVLRLVSQPLFALPSQLPNPAAHVGTHTPPVQAVVPFALVHATPHEPQFDVVASEVSQPFAMLLSQLAKPALHEPSWQIPELQRAVAFA